MADTEIDGSARISRSMHRSAIGFVTGDARPCTALPPAKLHSSHEFGSCDRAIRPIDLVTMKYVTLGLHDGKNCQPVSVLSVPNLPSGRQPAGIRHSFGRFPARARTLGVGTAFALSGSRAGSTVTFRQREGKAS